jgi:hypothetical protein
VTAGLILKRASASRPSGQWSDDDFDVLADDAVVGRIMKSPQIDRARSDLVARRERGIRHARTSRASRNRAAAWLA